MPFRIFISYAHDDPSKHNAYNELTKNLANLQRAGIIEAWSDVQIAPGGKWRESIQHAMDTCDLAILLLTPEFFNSEFISSVEQKTLLARHANEKIDLLPIRVEVCHYEITDFARFQGVPASDWIYGSKAKNTPAENWVSIARIVDEKAKQFNRSQEKTETIAANNSTAKSENLNTTLVNTGKTKRRVLPYPGLASFNPDQANYFFGRATETESLLKRLEQHNFLVVYGDSGSGKSSLLKAGVIATLRHKNPKIIYKIFTPLLQNAATPFEALANVFDELTGPDVKKDELLAQLQQSTINIAELEKLLVKACRYGRNAEQLILVIDQFEEALQDIPDYDAALFIKLVHTLANACVTENGKTHIIKLVLTIRADYFPVLTVHESISERCDNGQSVRIHPISVNQFETIIEGPTKNSQFRFEPGLVDELIKDACNTDSTSTVVPLIAYTLQKLQQPFEYDLLYGESSDNVNTYFTMENYKALGTSENPGLSGILEKTAQDAMQKTHSDASQLLILAPIIATVSASGAFVRRTQTNSETPSECEKLVKELVDQRLLVVNGSHIEVAHESLFYSWKQLNSALEELKEQIRLQERFLRDAEEWVLSGKPESLLWPHERLQTLMQALATLNQKTADLTTDQQTFITPEADRLIEKIMLPTTTHQDREYIGDRLSRIGDIRAGVGLDVNGRPDISWCEVVANSDTESIVLEDNQQAFPATNFKISRYPITIAQFQAFVDAGADGYLNDEYWVKEGLEHRDISWFQQTASGYRHNFPREVVTFYDAMAFCKWLDSVCNKEKNCQIRLPTEWEWQQAARRSKESTEGRESDSLWYEYPWAGEFNNELCNTVESRLLRTTAVGLYPKGAADCHAEDLAGGVWEWCLNHYDKDGLTDFSQFPADKSRVLRGGSFYVNQRVARVGFRYFIGPLSRDTSIGFRVCLSSPIMSR